MVIVTTQPQRTLAQLASTLRPLTLTVCGGLFVMGLLLVFTLLPDGTASVLGLLVGLVLGLVAIGASRVVPQRRTTPLQPGDDASDVVQRVRMMALQAAVAAEVPALLAFVLAVVSGTDRGAYLVAAPLAAVAVVRNATSTVALRRHAVHLESAGVSTGFR